jgi:hypothetical protein
MKPLRLKKRYIVLISIVLILIILRLILPSILLHRINNSLASLNDYEGHIDDLDLSLYKGSYSIKNMEIKRKGPAKSPLELIKLDSTVLSVEWKPLLHGHIVGQIFFGNPKIVVTKTAPKNIEHDTTSFNTILNKLMPLKVNRFEIRNGTIKYTDDKSSPKVDVSLQNIELIALNLSNVYDSVNALPSTISGRASVYEGDFNLNMKLNALADRPTFDLNAELKNTNLVRLNDFLKAYGNFTVNKGHFSLFTEVAASDGKFKGYVKPIIKDLDVLGPEDRKESFFQKIWESIVGAVGAVLTNEKKEQVATKIPIEGTFKKPKTKLLFAVGEALRNAFIQALMPGIDQEINIKSVKEDNKDFLHKMAENDKVKKKKK